MKMFRPLLLLLLMLLTLLLLIPTLIVQWIPADVGQVPSEERGQVPPLTANPIRLEESKPPIYINVYRTKLKQIEKIPLEQYIQGVVASEMPAEFELEALKAQSLAARTYIIRRLVAEDYTDTPLGSMVTDTEKHQVYQSEAELRERWGIHYEQRINRINQAVNETQGKILTYQGKPIDATFFSTSNGYTENSEDYWSQAIPYLRSVASPWDRTSPRYQNQLRLTLPEFQQKLGITLSQPVQTNAALGEIISHTQGKRVKEIVIGEQRFTGKEIRELLGLDSADFTWQIKGEEIIINTVGWGHGVGMSQWGAQGMAQEGYQAEEIVQHYYQDIAVEDYRHWLVLR